MAAFFDKWRDAKGHFEPGEARQADFQVVPPATPERKAADAGIECIGCGVCHSACDVVTWNKDYLGPGAAQPRLDAGQRRARRRQRRPHRRGVRQRRLPRLPQPHELHRVLPARHFADLFDRRLEARHDHARAGAEAMTAILFIAQRASAAVLAFAVTVHLATILYAVRGGLTAGEVLARTRDNHWFFAFYVLFVLAVAVHAPIGLRNVLREWTPLARPFARCGAGAVRVRCCSRSAFARRSRSICRRRRCSDDARLAQAAGLSRRAPAPARRHRAGDLPADCISGRCPARSTAPTSSTSS